MAPMTNDLQRVRIEESARIWHEIAAEALHAGNVAQAVAAVAEHGADIERILHHPHPMPYIYHPDRDDDDG